MYLLTGKGGPRMRRTLYDYCMEQGDEKLLREWDSVKNGDLRPETISYGSRTKVHWRCDKGHEWQAAVYSRTSGSGCPYCAGRVVKSGSNDLQTLFPEVAREWHPTKNAGLPGPDELSPKSHQRAYWLCEKGHEWSATVKSRTEGSGCPVCANREIVRGYNDLATTHPALAKEWDAEKNAGLSPRDVAAGSNRRVFWKCANGHSWRALVSSRACGGSGCPYCAGKQVLTGQNDLASAFPAIAAEWDWNKNNGLRPETLAPQSNRKVWWLCPEGHSYQADISARTSRGSGCPYCAGRKVLAGFNDLATKDPKLAKQWHPTLNGALTPEMVTRGSSKKVWWLCPLEHTWQAVISSRATGKKCGCPYCNGSSRVKFSSRYQNVQYQQKAIMAEER